VTTLFATLNVVARAIDSYMSGVDYHFNLVSTGFCRFCVLKSCYAPPIFASAVMYRHSVISIQNSYSLI